MTEVNIIIRTSDRTREAEVALTGSETVEDVVQAAVDNWSLSEDTDYLLVNCRTAKPLRQDASLESQDVKNGDVLEIRLAIEAASLRKSSIRWTDKSQSTPAAARVERAIVTCPNCKAGLHLPVQRSDAVTCPFCKSSVSATV